MITLSGKSVFGGVAIGKIAFYKRQEKEQFVVEAYMS